MNDIAYCPKPECLSPTVREDVNVKNAICGQCRYEFCVKCEKDSHQGTSSAEFFSSILKWIIPYDSYGMMLYAACDMVLLIYHIDSVDAWN